MLVSVLAASLNGVIDTRADITIIGSELFAWVDRAPE